MSDLRLSTGSSTPVRTSDDGHMLMVQGTRDGAMFTQDWLMAKCAEGRAFQVSHGVGTAPASFIGAFVATTPAISIEVPSTVVVIPLSYRVKYEAIGTEDEMEVVAIATNVAVASSAGTALTVMNLRVDAPVASLVTAKHTSTITTPATGNWYEFFRDGHPLVDTPATTENDRNSKNYAWTVGDAGYSPVIAGGGSIVLHACAQAATGFMSFAWIELPASALS